ncbi:MAG TPA: SprT family zinc-dependent metalloprotease [Devosiaceae bacterium]|jgi:predicted metal-dependent hydrolase|nr:SprT family zinc-dependent metalloprotease [Devosiaceae bacterium]
MIALLHKKWPEMTEASVDGRTVEIAVRVSTRARSYRLSIPHQGAPILTVPRYGRWSEAEAFLDRQTGWLAARLKRTVQPVSFSSGARVPVRGVEHVIVPTGRIRGQVEIGERNGFPALYVPGEPAHRPRRLADWLKSEAQRDLERRVAVHAGRLDVTVKSVRLRSQTTRWGSCSSRGNLNFNWRLVLAPRFVLDYVAAHEVAHLVEMNHSEAFWATVAATLPTMEKGRAWLKVHGRELMAYGAEF